MRGGGLTGFGVLDSPPKCLTANIFKILLYIYSKLLRQKNYQLEIEHIVLDLLYNNIT